MEIDNIYNMDCLEGMKQIPDGTIDAVICDLPYGTMKGIDDRHDWDTIIPTGQLFELYDKVLRRGGVAILFSQEPYTSHLRTYRSRNLWFCYPMIWKKDRAGNALSAKKAPVSHFEDINVFVKGESAKELNWLADYFLKIEQFLLSKGITKKNVEAGNIGGRARHLFSGLGFRLCTETTYNELIQLYGIDKMEGFMPFAELKLTDVEYKKTIARTFNLPEGQQSMSNVLEFSKDTDGFHPTQKPVALIRRLVLTYTNVGDTVLDNCMGSGTTAIACIKEKRHFIGFELNKDYFDKAVRRIKAEQAQLTLF